MSTNNTGVMAAAGAGLHGFAVPILTTSIALSATLTGPPEGTPFVAGFRTAMLVMGSILFAGVLLSATRRSGGIETPAKASAPILAAP